MRNVRLTPRLKAAMIGLVTVPTSLVLISAPLQSQSVQGVGADRWLEVEQVYGDVFIDAAVSREAQVGDRLLQSGDALTTARGASSTIAIDSAIGRVQMAQNTRLRVNQLGILSDGARVTLLDIPRGQVRVQARRFTNPNTRFEIQTPSGVAAVRGTDFGVSIGPSGRMAIATDSGAVEVGTPSDVPGNLENNSVIVNPGYVSTIAPGEAPSPPRLIDRRLNIEVLHQNYMGGKTRVKAKVDPANSVLVNGEEIVVDRKGTITTSISLHHSVIEVVVRNPMGETREHFIWIKDD